METPAYGFMNWRRLSLWLLPPVTCLWIHKRSLLTWYLLDDFQWLAYSMHISSVAQFLNVLLTPTVYGTFRPLSERLLFLTFGPLFRENALPLHILAFITFFGCLWLLAAFVRRLTGSFWAALGATLAWTATMPVTKILGWSSAYMQVLCGLLLLAALYFLARYEEHNERRDYRLQWVAFLLCFGVIETAIVYPALACGFSLLFHRRLPRGALKMWLVSVAYFAFHSLYARQKATGPYLMHFDAPSLAHTFAAYWQMMFAHPSLPLISRWPAAALPWLTGLFTLAVLGWTAIAFRRGNRLPLFGLVWFVVTLGPILPLREHISDYYLALPLAGIAMVLCSALELVRVRPVGLAFLALYCALQLPVIEAASRFQRTSGERYKRVILGVAAMRERDPQRGILLVGADPFFLGNVMRNNGFWAFGCDRIYLDPAEVKPENPDLHHYMLEPEAIRREIDRGRLRVITVAGDKLTDITATYRSPNGANRPRQSGAQ